MRVSILGHGIVGKGVWDMLQGNPLYDVRNVLVKKGEKTADFMVESFDSVLNDDSDLVIECMGGVDPAFEFTSKCLEAGKSLVTSNKALVAAHGIELFQIASRKGVSFLFSAACGGAIPILQNLCTARQTDSIVWAGGILNGTTNYILDSMDGRGLSLDDALREAQRLGYAEADPTADVSGMDTMRKIMLMSMVAYDVLPNSDYSVEGIQSVRLKDFETAHRMGRTIRLVGKCGLGDSGRLYAYVEPVMCDPSEPYFSVRRNANLAQYHGRNSGDMSFMGQGAGRYPTASNIMRDVSSIYDGQKRMLSPKCLWGFAYNDSRECAGSYYVRLDAKALDVLRHEVPIVKVVNSDQESHVVITEEVTVKRMHDAASEIRRKGHGLFFAEIGGLV